MKNKEIVKILIDKLKKQATTDFELHRVEVLERDFFNPPKPEQIDDFHQKFDGVIYHTNSNSEHLRAYTPIHRAVYRYYCSDIPDDCDIHHIDENPANNDISNLECLTKAEHRRKHNIFSPRPKAFCKICGNLIESYNGSKYCSRKCRDIAESVEKTCPVCGKKFKTNDRHTKHCSKRCGQLARQARRKEKHCQQTFVCKQCGKTYLGSESDSKIFCSSACYGKYSYYKRQETRTCVICGKEFSCLRTRPTKTCSQSCANYLKWKTRRENSIK